MRQLVDGAGQVTLAQGTRPFGAPLWQEGSGSSGFGFTGEQVDGSTGLVFLRARYYAPGVGRFLSLDPWRGDVQHPRTLERFVYVLNNAINGTDPSGLQCSVNIETGTMECFGDTTGMGQTSTIGVLPAIPGDDTCPYLSERMCGMWNVMRRGARMPTPSGPAVKPYSPPPPLMPGDCRPNDDVWHLIKYKKKGTGAIEFSSVTATDLEYDVKLCPIYLPNGAQIPGQCVSTLEVEEDTASGEQQLKGEAKYVLGVHKWANIGVKLDSDLEAGVGVELAGQSLELNFDPMPYFEADILGIHLRTRPAVYVYVLAAERTLRYYGYDQVRLRTWGREFEFDSIKMYEVWPGENPGIAMWYLRYRGYEPIKMFPGGDFGSQ